MGRPRPRNATDEGQQASEDGDEYRPRSDGNKLAILALVLLAIVFLGSSALGMGFLAGEDLPELPTDVLDENDDIVPSDDIEVPPENTSEERMMEGYDRPFIVGPDEDLPDDRDDRFRQTNESDYGEVDEHDDRPGPPDDVEPGPPDDVDRGPPDDVERGPP